MHYSAGYYNSKWWEVTPLLSFGDQEDLIHKSEHICGDLIQVLNFICTRMSILIFIFYTQGVVHPVGQIRSNMCQPFWLKFAYMEAHVVLTVTLYVKVDWQNTQGK